MNVEELEQMTWAEYCKWEYETYKDHPDYPSNLEVLWMILRILPLCALAWAWTEPEVMAITALLVGIGVVL